MINRESWARVRPIVEAALALPRSEVEAYLDRSCAGDAELRRQAELLLRATDQADGALAFMDAPAAELAAPLLRGGAGGVLEPGASVGNYTIQRLLGNGGMGMVYLARDHRLQRSVAVKLLPHWLPASDATNRRFVQEAQAASALDHPNIETIYEVGETAEGGLYIAMAHYEGETLQTRIGRGPLDVQTALQLSGQIASGLAAAHARGIVHRDIKPANVVITRDGVAKIVDFGAAKLDSEQLTTGAVSSGTIAYMSPEQTRGGDVDGRTDIWALGVVLYEMLTGQPPFRGDGPEAVIDSIRHDDPDPLDRQRPDVPPALTRLVHRCLEKDPAARFQTMGELGWDLERLRAGRRPVRRFVAAAGVAVILIAIATASLVRGRPVITPAATAIAVMPPVSVAGDTALARLGRELAVTISASLDGMGPIRTLAATTVLAHTGDKALSLGDAARLATRLGAPSFLYGTVVGIGDTARLDLELIAPADMKRIAQVSVSAPAADIGALTDSATLALLRRVWSRGTPPVPNLAAVTTRSVPALRAYLEGELAFARSRYDVAVSAFERAFAADTTFALAYWRSLYPRIYEQSRPDSAVVASIIARRDRLPLPDAWMVEAYAAPTVSARLEILRRVTMRSPDYWPGWYALADLLVHDGPYLGTTYADARAALERVVELNPDFASGWVHLHWITSLQRDTVAVNRTVANLERLAVPGGWVNPENLNLVYAFQEMLRSGEMSDSVANGLATGAAMRRWPAETRATVLFTHGFARGQLQQIDAVLRGRPSRDMAAAQWAGRAYAWAGRGSWDSVFVALEQWVRLSTEQRTPLRAYGLAALGTVTGGVEAARAQHWRPITAPAHADSVDWAAERAWLDGLVAYSAGDPGGIARATRALSSSSAEHKDLLLSSVNALHADASGSRAEAAQTILQLELTAAEHGVHRQAARSHPYLAAVHRPLAARWLLELGDTLQALKLLAWHEAILADGTLFTGRAAANRVSEPIALFERARIAEAWGWREAAVEHYRSFLARYDTPPAQHAPMIDASRAALRRLSTAGDTATRAARPSYR